MNKKLKKNQVIIYKKKFTKEEVKEIGNIIGFLEYIMKKKMKGDNF
ncbi:hypothetical protein [Peptoniphilus stercorisuis]|uniref:Uncharacterized protein n=1 Tax=Peptoniphilus stercorisuis TaxID=1436965 RepID=A0ABS4KGJ5_9FIRM|nr:hypothetical protein [Peptoniphilus stercorisuis]MBP2025759.1 hypothetical protein [Peptoniphilus stercorisuis]